MGVTGSNEETHMLTLNVLVEGFPFNPKYSLCKKTRMVFNLSLYHSEVICGFPLVLYLSDEFAAILTVSENH